MCMLSLTVPEQCVRISAVSRLQKKQEDESRVGGRLRQGRDARLKLEKIG